MRPEEEWVHTRRLTHGIGVPRGSPQSLLHAIEYRALPQDLDEAGSAESPGRIPSHNGNRAGRAASGLLLLMLGGVAGWIAHPTPSTEPRVQRPPLIEENAVFTDAQRNEYTKLVDGEKSAGTLGLVADTIIAQVPIRLLLRDDLHSQARADIKTCLALLGRASSLGSEVPGAQSWAKAALLHPDPEVRRTAAVWYPVIDSDWRKGEEIRHLVEAAKVARMND